MRLGIITGISESFQQQLDAYETFLMCGLNMDMYIFL